MDEVEDINRLIRELNAEGQGEASGEGSARLNRWLEVLVERRGSDLLLVAGSPPCVRTDGAVLPLKEAPVSGEEIEEAVLPALPGRARTQYAKEKIADASYKVPGRGRFRINLHQERGRAAAAVRALPSDPPRLASLGLPPGVEALTRLPRGLVLIGGPTGSGTSIRTETASSSRSRSAPTRRISRRPFGPRCGRPRTSLSSGRRGTPR